MRVSNYLREFAVCVATANLINLGLFIYTSLVIFNPFVSLMLLVASPFFYFMGIIAEKNEKR